MKKLLFLTALVFGLQLASYSQKDSSWVFTKMDSVSKSKNQIYSDSKSFIATTWKSAKNVIQNDDKDGGILILKATNDQFTTTNGGFASVNYYFDYTVTIKFKDNKYKIIINNVYCSLTVPSTWPKIQPGEKYPGMFKSGLSEEKYIKIQKNLKSELESIIGLYEKNIKEVNSSDVF